MTDKKRKPVYYQRDEPDRLGTLADADAAVAAILERAGGDPDYARRLENRYLDMQDRRSTAAANAQAERAAAKAQIIRAEPLTAVEITGISPTGRPITLGVAMRRSSEAALWASLAKVPDHERAACRIGGAFAVLDRGLGLQQSLLARAMREDNEGGPRPDPAWVATLLFDYFAWGKECTRRGISHAAIMDVLGYGKSCRAVERERRRRNGWARDELGLGLDLYGVLKGWRREVQSLCKGEDH